MNKILNVGIIVLFVTMLMCGCSNSNNKDTLPSANSLDSFTHDITSAPDVFSEDALTIYYNASNEIVKSFITAFTDNLEYIESGRTETDVTYTFKYPNLKVLTDSFLNSEGFYADYKKMKSAKRTDEEIKNYVIGSLIALINQGKYEYGTIELKTDLYNSKFSSNVELVNEIKSCILSLNNLTAVEDEKELEAFDASILNTAKSAFVYTKGKNRILISNINFIYGDDAIAKLKELSDVNDIACSDKIVFIEYDATNLSKKKTIVSSCFTGITIDGELLENDCTIVGLLDETPIKANNTVRMSDVVILGEDDLICWYANDIKGSVIVQE